MSKAMTVGDLEHKLFANFPREDAEPWDNLGLAVGDRSERIDKIAVSLDMSVEAVIAADIAGCNVLLTHHPAFIKEGPLELGPESQSLTTGSGRMMYEAIKRNVSCVAMHTNVDRSLATRKKIAQLMGCLCEGNCEFLFDKNRDMRGKGFGALLIPDWNEAPTLERISQIVARNFESQPRIWGNPERIIEQIAFINGSWSDIDTYEACIHEGVDCLIVGETKYHMCVDAQPYLSIIELGHDRSEFPLVDVLIDALFDIGLDRDMIEDLRPATTTWCTL